MAIKFATPKKSESDTDGIDKSDLVGALIAFTLREYDDKLPTVHGDTTAAFVDLVVVDGKLAGTTQERWAAFGNLGKQIGEALDEGDIAVGRITSGKSASGRSWFGIDYAEEPADFAAAEKALEAAVATAQAPAASDAPF